MPRQVWICETCSTPYFVEEGAQTCESQHRGVDDIQVTGATYDRVESGSQRSKMMRRQYPTHLHVRFSGEQWDIATYRLERIGPKGM